MTLIKKKKNEYMTCESQWAVSWHVRDGGKQTAAILWGVPLAVEQLFWAVSVCAAIMCLLIASHPVTLSVPAAVWRWKWSWRDCGGVEGWHTAAPRTFSTTVQSRRADWQLGSLPVHVCRAAAVTTPSAPNSTISLHSVTEFKVGRAVCQGSNLIYSDESVSNIS